MVGWCSMGTLNGPCYLSIYLNLSICLSICLSIYLFIYLSIIYLPIYLSVCLSLYLSIFVSIYLYIYLSIFLSIYLSFFLSIYFSFYLSIYPSIYLSVCLSIYLSFYLEIEFLYTFGFTSPSHFSEAPFARVGPSEALVHGIFLGWLCFWSRLANTAVLPYKRPCYREVTCWWESRQTLDRRVLFIFPVGAKVRDGPNK